MGGCESCFMWPAMCCAKKYQYGMHQMQVGSKFVFPGISDSGIYMPVPNADRDAKGKLKFSASLAFDVTEVRRCVEGCGTDEAGLIRVLCNRTPEQIEAIDELYFNEYGSFMQEDIENDLSGDVQAAAMMLCKGQAALDAQVLWDAFDGVGTDEERVNEILASRHPGQVAALQAQFTKLKDNKDGKSLFDVVCGDASFKYEKFLKCMCDRAGFLALIAYESMHGKKHDFTKVTSLGTRDVMLFRLLTCINKDNDNVKRILHEYQDHFDQGWREDMERIGHLPDMEDVVEAYENLWARGFGVNEDRRTLSSSIESETSGNYKEMLLWLVKDKDECGAEAIHDALEDFVISKDIIMIYMASRSAAGRSAISKKYKELYGVTLREDLSSKMDGMTNSEFNEVARDMFQDPDERMADYLYLAMNGATDDKADALIDDSKKDNMAESSFRSGMIGGLGTDEQRLSRTILFSSKGELKGLCSSYEKKFSQNLVKDIFSETGGDYRAMLMYKFRRGQTGLLHAPRQKLVRCDDMPSFFPLDAIASESTFDMEPDPVED